MLSHLPKPKHHYASTHAPRSINPKTMRLSPTDHATNKTVVLDAARPIDPRLISAIRDCDEELEEIEAAGEPTDIQTLEGELLKFQEYYSSNDSEHENHDAFRDTSFSHSMLSLPAPGLT